MRKPKLALTAVGLVALVLTTLYSAPASADSTSPLWNWNSKKCLGALGANMSNFTPVVQWTCDGSPNQQWMFAVWGTWTQIRNSQDPSKCLGVLNSATTDGSSLVIWDCNGSADQLWSLPSATVADPIECFNIYNNNAWPKVIGVLGGALGDGAQTVLWDYLGHDDQTWCTNFQLISP